MNTISRSTFIALSIGLIFFSVHTRAQTDSSATNEAPFTGSLAGTNSAPAPEQMPIKNAPGIVTPPPPTPHVASLTPADLREFETDSPAVQQLITRALNLTTLNLSYKYGSSDPKEGGMDCSGTVYYLLNSADLQDVPRDASGMYKWVWLHDHFRAVVSSNPNTFELAPLKPGDLLFWTGTYKVDRDPPVTHVMIYLGINRHTNRRVMVGASEGRRFNGKSQYGVSVFDFTMPGKPAKPDPGAAATSTSDLKARFIGYGPIPGLDGIKNFGDVPK